ncbi:MAG: hypothetical protein JXA69_03095, partial [Phycisphaerae bacterium]|nr:hypothetical protein [Phycisphaerae bacterium]
AQRQWHDPADVERAESLLPLAMAWGHAKRAEAERLAAGSNKLDAVLCLGEIERAYAGVSLAEAARVRRLEIEADPAVREALAAQARRRTEAAAMASYLDVQRLVAAGQFEEARRQCEIILTAYAGTSAAERADRLLKRLPRRNPR